MSQAPLHLVDTSGSCVRPAIQMAVEDAFRWALRGFPLVDPALIANWAEEVASSMEAMGSDLRNPGRYAAIALNGKVRDWQRTRPAKLELVGAGHDLERIGGTNRGVQGDTDQRVLFEQLKATLNDRDQVILLLLLDGSTDKEIASALTVRAPAARKAIQRMKERLVKNLSSSRTKQDPGHGSRTLCETKG